MAVFDQVYWHNTLLAWLISGSLLVGIYLLLSLVRRILIYKLRRTEAPEVTELGMRDLTFKIAGRTKFFFLIAVALAAALIPLELPARFDWFLQKAITIAIFLQLGLWGDQLVQFGLQRLIKRRAEGDPASVTALTAIGFLGRLALWSLLLLVGLQNLGVEVTGLIAGLGIGGLAVALAAQNILSDLFASLSIVLDKPFLIGDFLIVGEHAGNVEHIGLKTTRIRSLSGEQLVFSNTDLLGSRIRNFKRMAERRITFTVGVTYQTTYEQLRKIPGIIQEAVEAQENARFDRSHFIEYGDSSLVFETVYYVKEPDFKLFRDLQQEINLTLFQRFEKEGIEFAYPTRTLHFGNELVTRASGGSESPS